MAINSKLIGCWIFGLISVHYFGLQATSLYTNHIPTTLNGVRHMTRDGRGGAFRPVTRRWASTSHTSDDQISSATDAYSMDTTPVHHHYEQQRRHFLRRLACFSIMYPTSSLMTMMIGADDVTAIDIPSFLPPPVLLRTQTFASPSTTTTLVSPGAGADTRPLSYPTTFLGRWNLTSTYTGREYPLGERFVPRRIRSRGSLRRDEDRPGDSLSYAQEFVLSSEQQTNGVVTVVSNREFNARQQVNAQRGYDEVASVKYDAKNQRLTLLLNTLGADMQPLPPGRNELFLTNHRQEYTVETKVNSNDGAETITRDQKIKEKDVPMMLRSGVPYQFTTMEFVRTVTLGVRSTYVLETATYISYDINPTQQDRITAKQRICLFLPPLPTGEEGDMYFEARNRAVAVYDYDIVMERLS